MAQTRRQDITQPSVRACAVRVCEAGREGGRWDGAARNGAGFGGRTDFRWSHGVVLRTTRAKKRRTVGGSQVCRCDASARGKMRWGGVGLGRGGVGMGSHFGAVRGEQRVACRRLRSGLERAA